MKTNTIKRNKFLTLIAICLIACGIAIAFGRAGLGSSSTAYAMESEESIGCEGIEKIDREEMYDYLMEEKSDEFENIMSRGRG